MIRIRRTHRWITIEIHLFRWHLALHIADVEFWKSKSPLSG